MGKFVKGGGREKFAGVSIRNDYTRQGNENDDKYDVNFVKTNLLAFAVVFEEITDLSMCIVV